MVKKILPNLGVHVWHYRVVSQNSQQETFEHQSTSVVSRRVGQPKPLPSSCAPTPCCCCDCLASTPPSSRTFIHVCDTYSITCSASAMLLRSACSCAHDLSSRRPTDEQNKVDSVAGPVLLACWRSLVALLPPSAAGKKQRREARRVPPLRPTYGYRRGWKAVFRPSLSAH